MKRCSTCNKELPDTYAGNLCSLCAIGLTPAEPIFEEPEDHQVSYQVEGRALSGTYCPQCKAELTLADLSKRSCAICGSTIALELLRVAPIPEQVDQDSISSQVSPVQGTRWPDDAPLW